MSDLTQMGSGVVPASMTWRYPWDSQSTTLVPVAIPDSAAWRALLDKKQMKLNQENNA
jgi:hypothetical protein